MAEQDTALIVLDTEIVATTKRDQAIWLLQQGVQDVEDIIDRYSLLTVADDETKVEAEKAIMDIRKRRNAHDAGRKDWGSPLDKAKRAVDGAFKNHVLGPMQEQEERLISEVSAYTREQERKRREAEEAARKAAEEAQAKLDAERKAAEEKARKEAEAKGQEYTPPPAQGIPEVVVKTEAPKPAPKAEGIEYVRYWKFEVEDLSQVPDAYTRRVIDEQAVKDAIKAATVTPPGEKLSQCTAEIPGLRIYHEDRPRVG